jgi:hypothetical protein
MLLNGPHEILHFEPVVLSVYDKESCEMLCLRARPQLD